MQYKTVYSWQELPYHIAVCGFVLGGRAVGGRHAFVSGPLCENYNSFIYEIWPYALVVRFGVS